MKKMGQLLGIAASIATVLGLIITIAALSSRGNQSPGASAASTVVTRTAAPVVTVSPTSTLAPTATSAPSTQSIAENKSFGCTASGGCPLTAKLNSVTIDQDRQTTLWDFTFSFQGPRECTGFRWGDSLAEGGKAGTNITDPYGTMYVPTANAGYPDFTLSPGQSAEEIIPFPQFIPQTGTLYQFKLAIAGCGYIWTYQTQGFKF